MQSTLCVITQYEYEVRNTSTQGPVTLHLHSDYRKQVRIYQYVHGFRASHGDANSLRFSAVEIGGWRARNVRHVQQRLVHGRGVCQHLI